MDTKKLDTINDIINNHGNKFMIKVSTYLKDHWRMVQVSPHYIDIATGKTRELDIIASKKRKVWWGDYDEFDHFEIEMRLFIECKHIDRDFVAWSSLKEDSKIDDLLKQQPITRALSYESYRHELPWFLTKHHYKTRQYIIRDFTCKDTNKNTLWEWINQCLHSFIYFRDNHIGGARYTIDYPIVMVNSLNKTYITDWWDDLPCQVEENLLYQINHSYETKWHKTTEDFVIDVVSFEWIDNFLLEIETEKELYWHNLREHENFEARRNNAPKSSEAERFDTFWY